MPESLDKDLKQIEEAMNRFLQTMSRPRTWERVMDLAGLPIDRAGATLLHMLEHCQGSGCRLSDIAHKLGIEAPSVTRKVQQLEQEGLVERLADPKDGRAYNLHITKKGREVVVKLHKAKQQLFTEVLQNWPPEDRRNFAELFYKLSQDLADNSTNTKQSS